MLRHDDSFGLEAVLRAGRETSAADGGEADQVTVGTAADAGHAVLAVANSGPLVPANQLDRLFQPFQRIADERTGHRDGLRLGLSIVHAIATAHAATLAARAQPDGGLHIDVRFPAA